MDDDLEEFASSGDEAAHARSVATRPARRFAFVTPPRPKDLGHVDAGFRPHRAWDVSRRRVHEDEIDSGDDEQRCALRAPVAPTPRFSAAPPSEEIEGFVSDASDDVEPQGLAGQNAHERSRAPFLPPAVPPSAGTPAMRIHDSGGKKRRRVRGPLGEQLRRALAAASSDNAMWLHGLQRSPPSAPAAHLTLRCSGVRTRGSHEAVRLTVVGGDETATVPSGAMALVVSADGLLFRQFHEGTATSICGSWTCVRGSAGQTFLVNAARCRTLQSPAPGNGPACADAEVAAMRRETFSRAAATGNATSTATSAATEPIRSTPIGNIDPYSPAIAISGTVRSVSVGGAFVHVAVEDLSGLCVVRHAATNATTLHAGVPFVGDKLRVVGRTRDAALVAPHAFAFVLAADDET